MMYTIGSWTTRHRRLYRLRLHAMALRNWLRGYAWSCVQRCRTCSHTVYDGELRSDYGCRYCNP